MSPVESRPCPHELRPGTTVCLYCRREERMAARARFRRQAVRAGAAFGVIAVFGVGALLLMVRRSAAGQSHPTVSAAPVPKAAARESLVVAQAVPNDSAAANQPVSASAGPAQAGAPRAQPAPQLRATGVVPVIPQGRRDLNPLMFAERVGDTVVVHFDTRDTRTRRSEKFERTVRETLPEVYGPLADSMLARVPEGTLASGGDLISELPSRGIRLVAPDGSVLMLRPEIRPGRDGPLVVSYRVTAAR